MHHNYWSPAHSILDLFPIIRIPIHCHIHRKTQIDPMATLSIPTQYGLIITYEIQTREELCAILIKTSNKVFNDFHRWASWLIPPPCKSEWWLHQTCLHIILKRWLLMPVFTKEGAELYFYWETVDYTLVLSPNSKCVDRLIIPNHLIISS